jgi:acetoacetate decarboxylase
MRRKAWFIVLTCICAFLAVAFLGCITANQATTDKEVKKEVQPAVRPNFVPSPEFSPPYPPLPHHFGKSYGLQILCQAPKGAIARALARPLEPAGDAEQFVLLMGWSPDCEGYNVHEIAINAPVKWNDKTGNTTLIEYIDSGMGLITGREVWGWPKKMADITWTQTATGWTITVNAMKDQNSIPLMKIEFKASNSTPEVKWPEMGPTLLVKRIANASPTVPPLTQLVCVGCNLPPRGSSSVIPMAPKGTKGIATVQFFDGPHDPLTFFGPVKVLDAKMSISEGSPTDPGLGLGEVIYEWKE